MKFIETFVSLNSRLQSNTEEEEEEDRLQQRHAVDQALGNLRSVLPQFLNFAKM